MVTGRLTRRRRQFLTALVCLDSGLVVDVVTVRDRGLRGIMKHPVPARYYGILFFLLLCLWGTSAAIWFFLAILALPYSSELSPAINLLGNGSVWTCLGTTVLLPLVFIAWMSSLGMQRSNQPDRSHSEGARWPSIVGR